MTATTQIRIITNSYPRPRGIDALIMSMSITMLTWARRRADRSFVSAETQSRRLDVAAGIRQRELAALRLAR